ncbi:hypothetical protein RFI_23979 [Reticulomyxa filosa]|uniref:Endonuclease/exonuclease/phosphatase domain-containing protein n=1 Tax=Reticulomyxa filosa TaxID=46433 RepID=X6MK32_RETFI|nr:hypothetical protein RFI_23979 [Reticulomyxa filosa]|eukprot:ETO13395.1 hypothetical protein RFI_23979 [Reticulomyxa filosa]
MNFSPTLIEKSKHGSSNSKPALFDSKLYLILLVVLVGFDYTIHFLLHNLATVAHPAQHNGASGVLRNPKNWVKSESEELEEFFEQFKHNESVIRIMTFNLRNELLDMDTKTHSWSTRKAMLIKTLLKSRPSLLGTQEGTLSQLNEINDILQENKYQMLGSSGRLPKGVFQSQLSKDNEFCEIFIFHKMFSVLDKGTFSLSETPNQLGSKYTGTILPRIATWALLSLKNPHARWGTLHSKYLFLFINTHLDHLHLWARQKEIQIIEAFIAEMWNEYQTLRNFTLLVFVTGDFNENENGKLWHEIVNVSLLANEMININGNNNNNNKKHNKPSSSIRSQIKLLDCVKEWTKKKNTTLNAPLTFHRWEGLDYIPKDTNGAPIDWILCTPNVIQEMHLLNAFVVTWNSTILDTTWNQSQYGTIFPSDHFPLYLDIAFKSLSPL